LLYFNIPQAIGCVVLIGVVSTSADAQEVRKGLTYQEIHFDPKTNSAWEESDKITKFPGWQRDKLLDKALERTNSLSAPLFKGWIDRNIFVQIRSDRRDYFVLQTLDEAHAKICYIVSTREHKTAQPDLPAIIEPDSKNCTPPKRSPSFDFAAYKPDLPRGVLGAKINLNASDGTKLLVQHVRKLRGGSRPVPPDLPAKGLTEHFLPQRLSEVSSGNNTPFLVHYSPGKWGLAVKFPAPYIFQQSGCFITAKNNNSTLPSMSWITGDLKQWCQIQDKVYNDTLPNGPVRLTPAPMPSRPSS